MKLAIIGAGNMAQALVRGALDAGLLTAADVVACRRNPERLAAVADALGVAATTDPREAVGGADLILFAVKPQQALDAMRQLGPALTSGQLVLSVLAGTTTRALQEASGRELPVVRCMPNTPAFVGQGMAPYCLGAYATADHGELAASFLAASGRVLAVDESEIDAITAVSGCGPAYLFYLAEGMMAGASALGLSESAARGLVDQTLLGAAAYLSAAEADAGTLRRQVTSPGGATAEAIATFDRAELRTTIRDAMIAAATRARELGRS